MPVLFPFSPAEVIKDVVTKSTDPEVTGDVIVGPLSDAQQKAGAVSIMDAGTSRDDQTGLLIWPRMQLRCVGPTLDRVEQIGRHVGFALNSIRGRVIGHQSSTDDDYLVHSIRVNGGPSAHQDTPDTWEYLIFAEAMMGTTPVPSSQ